MIANSDLMIRSATDPEFRSALLADPKAVLAAEGMTLPPGSTVRVEESTSHEMVFVLPPALPDGMELDDDALAGAAGGATPLIALLTGAAFIGAAGGGAAGYAIVRGF